MEKDNEGKMVSKVSSKWQEIFKEFFLLCFYYVSEHSDAASVGPMMDLNPNLTSHCGKKYAAQFMGETTCLSPLATVFRCGWEMRNVHTLFDYLVSSAVNDRKSA